MNSPTNRTKITADLQALLDASKVHQEIEFADLVHRLSVRGHALLCLALGFPFMLPVPLIGVSQIFGPVIALAGLQMAMGKEPWVPKRWRHHKISHSLLEKCLTPLMKTLKKLEHWVKPRLLVLSATKTAKCAVGLSICACGILLALPLPPGTNAPPAIAIVVLALGFLESDGTLVLIGLIISVLNYFMFAKILLVGTHWINGFFAKYFF